MTQRTLSSKRLGFITAALLASLLGTAASSAHAEYICGLFYHPSPASYGSYGYVRYESYSGPNCTGTFYGYKYLCSKSATSSSCVKDTTCHYSEASLLAVYDKLFHATREQANVSGVYFTCNNNTGSCPCQVYFSGN